MQLLSLLLLSLNVLAPSLTSARLIQGGHNLTTTISDPSHTASEKRFNAANVAVNTCVRLNAATSIDVYSNNGRSVTKTALAANTCLCIDSVTAAGVFDPSGETVQVVSSSGVTFTGKVALDISKAITNPARFAGDASAYVIPFAQADVCTYVAVSLLNGGHAFGSRPATCCATSCNSGYSRPTGSDICYPNCPTSSTMNGDGTCTAPTCDSKSNTPYLCGTTCVKNKNNCQSGIPTLKDKSRKRGLCAGDMTRCAVTGWSGQSGWECVDVKSDIESCGGCTYGSDILNPRGEDCTALPNVNEVTCDLGSCQIRSCQRGFVLSNDGTGCDARPGRVVISSHGWKGSSIQE